MNEAERNREIADGYIEAALFTNGVDSAPGEYQVDPDKVASLAIFGASGVAEFIGLMGDDLDLMAIDNRRIGHCIHYEREGHGVGFMDEESEDDSPYGTPVALLEIARDTARSLGPDDDFTLTILDRFETT